MNRRKTPKRFLFVTYDLLPSEGAALGQSSLATGRLAKDSRAASADNDGLGVREDCGDCEAAVALNIHEERSGAGHKHLLSRKKKVG